MSSRDYWLGVATLPALVVAGFLLLVVYARVTGPLIRRGWFWLWRAVYPSEELALGFERELHGGYGLYVGVVRGPQWGSRFVAVGYRRVGVTIGRKSDALAVDWTA